MNNFANLHIHTYFSDGISSPAELCDQIERTAGLSTFAVTDHDSMSAIEPLFQILEQRKMLDTHNFIPGIELTTFDDEVGIVHILGYFPHIDVTNYRVELAGIEKILGSYCLKASENRGKRDVEGRLRTAFQLNIDNIAEHYESAEEVTKIIKQRKVQKVEGFWAKHKNSEDIIHHPIPLNYQDIINQWELLLPHSTTEKAMLYCLRSDPGRIERMTQLLEEAGYDDEEATALGSSLQGALVPSGMSGLKYPTPVEALSLLKQCGGLVSIAHPGISWPKYTLEEFEERVVEPMQQKGLDGIELDYPYHIAHRNYLTGHYKELAKKYSLAVTGGSDYHGDTRSSLADIPLDLNLAEKFFSL